MGLMTPEQRNELLDTFAKDAFHLELRDDYRTAYEEGPVAKWLRGEPDDFAWMTPWLDRIRRTTQVGKTFRRVRVITEPLSDYIRWEHSVTHLNVGAGEDIRWLPRHLVPEWISFPADGNDWWLLDDRLVTVGHFDGDMRVLGSELVTDPAVVADCIRIRDQLWSLAIPHREYRPA
ncbi:DUF6879 family protein [Actinoallomurus sp. NPDC050550]|uniref:DUF6879 family protein n=1 Tax=Actinoallomurus sp. NPDC050550 TaxID=3154937 RepID=UPI0033C48F81